MPVSSTATVVPAPVNPACQAAGAPTCGTLWSRVARTGPSSQIRLSPLAALRRAVPAAPAAGDHHYEIVGPVCESSDVVGRDRMLPLLKEGDVVAIRDAGAYGSAMASNYNRRPLPAEVLVDAGAWRVIRRRQTVDDMLTLES